MTIVPMFLLTLGAINWGYVYPLVFLFTALLRQRVLGKEICFNFLYASSFWLLLAAGMSYALIGVRTISGVYHHGILPVIAFAIGWILADCTGVLYYFIKKKDLLLFRQGREEKT